MLRSGLHRLGHARDDLAVPENNSYIYIYMSNTNGIVSPLYTYWYNQYRLMIQANTTLNCTIKLLWYGSFVIDKQIQIKFLNRSNIVLDTNNLFTSYFSLVHLMVSQKDLTHRQLQWSSPFYDLHFIKDGNKLHIVVSLPINETHCNGCGE